MRLISSYNADEDYGTHCGGIHYEQDDEYGSMLQRHWKEDEDEDDDSGGLIKHFQD